MQVIATNIAEDFLSTLIEKGREIAMYRLVAFTGAGISKASGIPTFEELGDIRDKLSRDFFESHPREFYNILNYMKQLSEKALPNPAHLALAEYGIPVVTMNIDGLHKKAGSSKVIEVHGSLDYVFCGQCGERFGYGAVEQSVHCPECSSLLQPNVVLYGDNIPLFYDAIDIMSEAEELLVVGTSFFTSTASHLVGLAQGAGVRVTTINANAEEKVPQLLAEIFSDKK